MDVRLSATRDLAAAGAFFRRAWTVTRVPPDRITTDGHDAYPRAMRNVFGDRVLHRASRHLNNHLEPDHRGIKPCYWRTGGLKTLVSAACFCRVFDEIRAFLRPQLHRHHPMTLAHRRHIQQDQFAPLLAMMVAA